VGTRVALYGQGVGPIQAAMWGVLGGVVVEALEHAAAIRRVGGWPWTKPGEPGLWPSLFAVILRLAAGAGLAAASGASGQVAGAFGAFCLGVTAPLVVEKMFERQQTGSDSANRSSVGGTAAKRAPGRKAAKKAPAPRVATNPSNAEESAHGS
jgi:hypothetical protein